MTYLMALDQGTTSSRTLIFTADGRLVAQAQREFAQHFPEPGQVEHDPDEIWASQRDTMHAALAQAGLAADAIAALGITNQRETTLIWERASGRPIHRALVWQDRRTEPLCRQWRDAGHDAAVRARTGLVIDPYFSASKIAWLLDHVPGARARAERGELAFGTVDSWLCWQLTGGARHVTDVTNASRTLLFDIRRGVWDDALLAAFGIPAALLPEVVPSAGVVAVTQAALLGAPIPIAGLAGDQQAALAGQACFTPGLAKNTYGTGCFLLLATGETFMPSAHGLLTVAAARTGAAPAYALEGSVFVGGAVVQWLRDGLHAIARSEDVEALAASVPDAGGVTFVPAFTGLGAPHWRADARGALFGLTRGSTTAHIARAALESIACQSADLLAAMQADSGMPLAELRVDGGASRNDALMQFQADLLGLPVVRPQVTETTALGAALLAGLGAGVYADTADLAAHWRAERLFAPQMSRDEATARLARWHRAVQATLAAPGGG